MLVLLYNAHEEETFLWPNLGNKGAREGTTDICAKSSVGLENT